LRHLKKEKVREKLTELLLEICKGGLK